MPEWIQTFTVDASYSPATGVTGVGIVIQERFGRSGRGPIVGQLSESHRNISVGDGELYAVFRALEVAKLRGFARIKVRSDYNHMRRSLRERYREGGIALGLEGRVLQLARSFDWIDFGYVPRRKNQAAHVLARKATQLLPAANEL
jgi:ribonuclease HI